MLDAARRICGSLPASQLGRCVVGRDLELFRGGPSELDQALRSGSIAYHDGRIAGAWPCLPG
jgi:hypothetical protein